MDTMKGGFEFERFEKMRSGQTEAASAFLKKNFSIATEAKALIGFLERGGAKCTFAEDRGHFYFCVYIRPGHGLMALVSSIEWHIIVDTGPDGKVIERISAVRGDVGM